MLTAISTWWFPRGDLPRPFPCYSEMATELWFAHRIHKQSPCIDSTSIAVADFNGDGKLDVALTNSVGATNAVAIVLGNGDGTFQNPPILYGAGLLPAGVVSSGCER